MPDEPRVRETTLRDRVQVLLSDGRAFDAPRGTPLHAVFRMAYADDNAPVAAIVDGELRELAWPVVRDIEATPVRLSDSDGMRIYSRSLSFLLVVVASQLFPEAAVRIDYSVPQGGYFCLVENREPFTSDELYRIKTRMMQLVREDRPIVRHRLSYEEVRALFAARGEEAKARQLLEREGDHLHLYSLDGVSDYFYGYMVPSTGILRTFSLEPFPKGFILRFPRREDPTKLLPSRKFTALREVFDEYGNWLSVLGMRDVGSLNEAIRDGRIEQVILVSEALHEKRIAEIAATLARKLRDGTRLVFIAGPSASGKTTFSKRLAIQLLANGVHPFPLEMDDYFFPRDVLQDRFGAETDFDALSALDVDRLREDLAKLLAGVPVELPRYDFRTGKRACGATIRLDETQMLLVEGIHGLNPELSVDPSVAGQFRIFVSALTQLNLDMHNRVSTTDTRLIRRIVRDALYRGYAAAGTLSLWDNVRRGEKENIFPHQEGADIMFNSALGYELSVLKPLVEPLLLQVREPEWRIEAERLLALLRWFDPYHTENIPKNSILREFIGGSNLHEFASTFKPTAGCAAEGAP
ncbi:MAG: nucleoside kinase [Candidatus Bipolaricaulis sp.]|nr:nucleoside kinase [Candidatus Bipolaricaulis sp.]MDD5219141.1 nucleoside kinase [Candidatus Bipolaricaulis sp.]MDD5645727.1 nucleoside kinase [Candidatus Bipolaricaulis sp.]